MRRSGGDCRFCCILIELGVELRVESGAESAELRAEFRAESAEPCESGAETVETGAESVAEPCETGAEPCESAETGCKFAAQRSTRVLTAGKQPQKGCKFAACSSSREHTAPFTVLCIVPPARPKAFATDARDNTLGGSAARAAGGFRLETGEPRTVRIPAIR